jgi:hypothetical protein
MDEDFRAVLLAMAIGGCIIGVWGITWHMLLAWGFAWWTSGLVGLGAAGIACSLSCYMFDLVLKKKTG